MAKGHSTRSTQDTLPLAAAGPVATAPVAPYRRRMKHWRDRWSDGAPLIWNRPFRDLDGVISAPGSPLTDEQRKRLKAGRVKRFWKLGYLVNAQPAHAVKADPVASTG
jgi:hypothetical protein